MVQIQIEDKVAAVLVGRAKARGLSLEEYLGELAIRDEISAGPPLSGDEAIRLIEAEAGPGNPAYHGTYSREDIYLDHD